MLRTSTSPADRPETMDEMRVGVIDVGSNTVRLLAASVGSSGVVALREERAHLGLGEEILRHGRIRGAKLKELTKVTGEYARIATKLRVQTIETVITAPGRQGARPERLVEALAQATGGGVRIVSSEEEGRLAYEGAVSRADVGDDVVAVCDVGGGSTEIVVGMPLLGPAWVRSIDIGSLRLTLALLHGDPPSVAQIETAREVIRAGFEGIDPPRSEVALATGGSARAIARIVGGRYGSTELERVVSELARKPSARAAKTLGVAPHRARVLLAGALILHEVSLLLELPFTPARGGIREGIALRLASQRLAA